MKIRTFVDLATLALLASSGSALLAQGGEPSYSPEGAWFAWATINGRQFPFMDTYTSDARNQGSSGTVLCTLATGKFLGPPDAAGTRALVSTPQTAQGNWIRMAKDEVAFTAWRILVDEMGRPVGRAKFWGKLTLQTNDSFIGTMNVAYFYGPSVVPFSTLTGRTEGARMAIEQE